MANLTEEKRVQLLNDTREKVSDVELCATLLKTASEDMPNDDYVKKMYILNQDLLKEFKAIIEILNNPLEKIDEKKLTAHMRFTMLLDNAMDKIMDEARTKDEIAPKLDGTEGGLPC